jgi:hypothetical protein
MDPKRNFSNITGPGIFITLIFSMVKYHTKQTEFFFYFIKPDGGLSDIALI